MANLQSGERWIIRRAASSGPDLSGVAYSVLLDLWSLAGPGAFSLGQILTVTGSSLIDLIPVFNAQTLSGSKPLNAIAANADGSVIWAVGDDQHSYRSVDGSSWPFVTIPNAGSDATSIRYGLATGGNLFTCVGPNILAKETSSGAGTWTQLDASVTGQQALTDGGPTEHWVSVGNDGVSRSDSRESADGLTWAAVNPSTFITSQIPRAISQTNAGLWVAVHDTGLVSTSPTGVHGSWTTQLATVPENLHGVEHLVGVRWVAVGDGGVILLSTDNAQTWKQVGVGVTSEDLQSVAYDAANDLLVACGSNGLVITSQATEVGELDDTPVAPEPLVANPRIVQEAIGRLAGQFRSGSGEPE